MSVTFIVSYLDLFGYVDWQKFHLIITKKIESSGALFCHEEKVPALLLKTIKMSFTFVKNAQSF